PWAAGSGSPRARGKARPSRSSFRSPHRRLGRLTQKPAGYSAVMHDPAPTAEERAPRVLVIDDEPPIRLLCRVNLEAEGMEVLEAADGPSGLESARTSMPDVILLDVMMPGLDGWQVAEELLEDERTSGIAIVFLTARAAL